MRFNSEAERLEHPQARLIPASLWKDYELFGHRLPDDLLPLMTASDDEVLLQIQQNREQFDGFQKKQCAWFAIMYSHPLLSVESLVSLGLELNMNYDNLFGMSTLCGRLDVLRYLEEKAPERLQAMIGAGNYSAFRYAARNGHLDVLRYFEEKAPDRLQAMIEANGYGAFRSAADNGHLDVLRYLEEKAPDRLQVMIEADGRC